MSDKVIVKLNGETLCTGTVRERKAPYTFWNAVIVDADTVDRDALVERLQASNTRWEGYVTETDYVLLLPPIFDIEAV